jgi:hypothetical protein
MDLNPLPPLPPTLTPVLKPKVPPNIPPIPSITMPFPENTPYRAVNNPFCGPMSKGLSEMHKKALQDALSSVRGPFLFNSAESYNFDGACVGVDAPSDSFNSAVNMVIAALERGYFSNRDPAPLGPSDWARLSSALLAAIGRGYHRQYTPDQEAMLEKMRAGAADPNPLLSAYPTFFHRLSVTAEEVAFHIGTDAKEGPDGYQEWYSVLKNNFTKKATKAAAAEVDEKWLTWKANELDRLAMTFQREIGAKAREKGKSYFIETAERLGLQVVQAKAPTEPTPPPSSPTTGRKRTASGSRPRTTPATPTTPVATRINPPRAAKRNTSTSPAPRGRDTTPTSQITSRVDPSPTPRLRKKAPPPPIWPRPDPEEVRPVQAPPPGPPIMTPEQPNMADLTARVLSKILARLEALEKRSMPPPARQAEPRNKPAQAPFTPREETNPYCSMPDIPQVVKPTEGEEEGDFTPVTRNGKGKKGKGKTKPPQINLTPASYASAAASATNTKQPEAPPKPNDRLPAITEVTVIRSGAGGHADSQIEMSIRARAPDAIVREVRLKMKNAVPNPIPLRAGRWSVQARSKGNFVYSFDGNIPFDLIETYERILLAPFYGSGKLSPSMGWTRLLAHGVPVLDENWFAFGPEELLKEVKTMPGLKKAHFAMPPRWLKPIERIDSDYSTITFAISDPDGSITSTLLKGRTALFGKEVTLQRWVDKPMLVQCSRCHALGHIKTSRACQLGKDSAKCYICGGAHQSETHDRKCPRKHTIAGICDCSHFKCLNCNKTGHDCRDTRCPARDLFRPRTNRKTRRPRKNSNDKDWAPEGEPSTTPAHPTLIELDDDGDLYSAPLPPNPTRHEVRTALHHQGIDNICEALSRKYLHPQTENEGASGSNITLDYDLEEFPEALSGPEPMDTELTHMRLTDYSPSRPQGDATNVYLA